MEKNSQGQAMKPFISLLSLIILCSCAHVERRVSLPETIINPSPRFLGEENIAIPGVNIAGEEENFDNLLEAKRLGVSFIILTPSKWRSLLYPDHPSTFLLGKNIYYEGLIKEDVERLRRVLDWAALLDLKVILSFLLVPGLDSYDSSKNVLFASEIQQERAWQFFYDIALHLGDHEALIAIDPLGSPTPEQGKLIFNNQENYRDWYKKIIGTPQDLNKFYKAVVKSIRKVRNQLPIVINPGLASHPSAFETLEPILDDDILYAFKWPQDAISKEEIERQLRPVIAWQKKYDIDNDRILVSSFAVSRKSSSAKDTLKNLHDVFRQHSFIHAFSGFREYGEDEINIELGAENKNESFWQAVKENITPHYHKLDKSEFLDALSLKRIVFQKPLRAFLLHNPDEKSLHEFQQFIEQKNLDKAGFNTIILDNDWQDPQLSKEKIVIANPQKFPHGLKTAILQAQRNNFAIGLAITMGMRDSHEQISGTFGNEVKNAQVMKDYAIDFLMLREGFVDDSEEWNPEVLYATLYEWNKQLGTTRIKIFADTNTHHHWFAPLVSASRTARTIRPSYLGGPTFMSVLLDEFSPVIDAVRINSKKFLLSSDKYNNFPGYLNLSKAVDPAIEKTYISLWAIMGAPFIVSASSDQLSDIAIAYLGNETLAHIHLDQYEPGRLLIDKDNVMIFRKHLSTGETAYLLVNLRKNTLAKKFSRSDLNALSTSTIISVANNKNYKFKDNSFEIVLKPYASELFLVK
jgi:hypothetical protein